LASIVFGTRGYESILFDLRGCDIIFDEIHTYTDITQAIVLKAADFDCLQPCSQCPSRFFSNGRILSGG